MNERATEEQMIETAADMIVSKVGAQIQTNSVDTLVLHEEITLIMQALIDAVTEEVT
jgi:hypothetical protein